MKKFVIIAITFFLISRTASASRIFDQGVSEARRHMRAACQAVQRALKTADVERSAVKESAAEEAAEALSLWTELTREHVASVPEGYAGDPGWAQRLEDVRLNIARMWKEIAADEWRPAFLSCAHACNLLGTMHEANGVTLAIDAMSVLRRKVGFAIGLLASGKPEKAGGVVKEIMAARDAVLLSPPPDTPTREAYQEALPELSRSVDALARSLGDRAELKTSLDKLASVVEKVYELAI